MIMLWQCSLSAIPTFGSLLFIAGGLIPYYIFCGKKKVAQKPGLKQPMKQPAGDSVVVTFTSKENKGSKNESKDKSANKTQTEDPDLLSIVPKDVPAKAPPAKKAGTPDFKAPVNLDEAGKKDPQYQTLIGLDNEVVFGPAKAGPKKIQIKAPNKVMPIADKNPQYETLAGLANDDLFQKKDGEVVKKKNIKAPKEVKPKDFKDPQYQTLAGLVNNDLFPSKEKEKKGKEDDKKGKDKETDPKKKVRDDEDEKKSTVKTKGISAGAQSKSKSNTEKKNGDKDEKTEKDDEKEDDEADKK